MLRNRCKVSMCVWQINSSLVLVSAPLSHTLLLSPDTVRKCCLCVQGAAGEIYHTSEERSLGLHRSDQTYLYHKQNGYVDHYARKMWYSCSSACCTCFTWCAVGILNRFVLKLIAKPSHTEKNSLCEVLGNLRMMFMKLVQVFLA
jgi:hypothetical protein